MGVTIKQIAEAAGVSRGTVDRALNDRPNIRPSIAEHVKKVAIELGYKPNLAAKLLVDQRYEKRTIGVILVTENNPFFDEVMNGVQSALNEFAEFGIANIVKTIRSYNVSAQLQVIDDMVKAGVNGIVMTPIQSTEIAEKINWLNENDIKVVTINTDITGAERMAYVGCSHRKSGDVLAGLLGLISVGNPMKIGVIAGTEKNLAVTRRLSGLLNTLKENYPNIQVSKVITNEENEELSYAITTKMLQEQPDIDTLCVLGAGIINAIRAVNAVNQNRKLRFIVYDLISEVKKGLIDNVIDATITQEPFKQGYEGVQIIGRYLAYGQLPEKVLNLTELAIVTKYCLNEYK